MAFHETGCETEAPGGGMCGGETVRDDVILFIPALQAFARSFKISPEDADDLVQETLYRALKSLHQYRPGTGLKSWLFTIMRNTFCSQYKTKKRESTGRVDCASLDIPTDPTQEWSVFSHEMQRALLQLKRQHREVLVLVAGLGTSYEDAAETCGCTVGTIKSRLSRARDELSEQMQTARHATV